MPYLISILEFTIFLTALQYLVGEATILDRLRVKLPALAQQMVSCPSCFGFWLGVIAGPLGLGPWGHGRPWWSAAGLSGLAALVLVPVFRGMMALGWAVSGAGHSEDHDHDPGHEHEHPVEAPVAEVRLYSVPAPVKDGSVEQAS